MNAIELEGLGKRYQIRTAQRRNTLRDVMAGSLRAAAAGVRDRFTRTAFAPSTQCEILTAGNRGSLSYYR